MSEELTKFRMKVVDENESVKEIENKIKKGPIELLIIQAHNELKLIRIIKELEFWELEKKVTPEELEGEKMVNQASFYSPDMSISDNERFEQSLKPPRPDTADITNTNKK